MAKIADAATKIAKTVGAEIRKGRQSRAAKKASDLKAKGQFNKDKVDLLKAKAELAKAKSAAKRTLYRSNAAATAASSYSQQGTRAAEALKEWNDAVNGTSTPAEGTGDAQPGSKGGTGSSTGVAPTGY